MVNRFSDDRNHEKITDDRYIPAKISKSDTPDEKITDHRYVPAKLSKSDTPDGLKPV